MILFALFAIFLFLCVDIIPILFKTPLVIVDRMFSYDPYQVEKLIFLLIFSVILVGFLGYRTTRKKVIKVYTNVIFVCGFVFASVVVLLYFFFKYDRNKTKRRSIKQAGQISDWLNLVLGPFRVFRKLQPYLNVIIDFVRSLEKTVLKDYENFKEVKKLKRKNNTYKRMSKTSGFCPRFFQDGEIFAIDVTCSNCEMSAYCFTTGLRRDGTKGSVARCSKCLPMTGNCLSCGDAGRVCNVTRNSVTRTMYFCTTCASSFSDRMVFQFLNHKAILYVDDEYGKLLKNFVQFGKIRISEIGLDYTPLYTHNWRLEYKMNLANTKEVDLTSLFNEEFSLDSEELTDEDSFSEEEEYEVKEEKEEDEEHPWIVEKQGKDDKIFKDKLIKFFKTVSLLELFWFLLTGHSVFTILYCVIRSLCITVLPRKFFNSIEPILRTLLFPQRIYFNLTQYIGAFWGEDWSDPDDEGSRVSDWLTPDTLRRPGNPKKKLSIFHKGQPIQDVYWLKRYLRAFVLGVVLASIIWLIIRSLYIRFCILKEECVYNNPANKAEIIDLTVKNLPKDIKEGKDKGKNKKGRGALKNQAKNFSRSPYPDDNIFLDDEHLEAWIKANESKLKGQHRNYKGKWMPYVDVLRLLAKDKQEAAIRELAQNRALAEEFERNAIKDNEWLEHFDLDAPTNSSDWGDSVEDDVKYYQDRVASLQAEIADEKRRLRQAKRTFANRQKVANIRGRKKNTAANKRLDIQDRENYSRGRYSKQVKESKGLKFYPGRYFRVLRKDNKRNNCVAKRIVASKSLFISKRDGSCMQKSVGSGDKIIRCNHFIQYSNVPARPLPKSLDRQVRGKTGPKSFLDGVKPLRNDSGAVVERKEARFGNNPVWDDMPQNCFGVIYKNDKTKEEDFIAQCSFVGNYTVVAEHTLERMDHFPSKNKLDVGFYNSSGKFVRKVVKKQKEFTVKDSKGKDEKIFLFSKPDEAKSLKVGVIPLNMQVCVPIFKKNLKLAYSYDKFNGTGYHCSTFPGVCNSPVLYKLNNVLYCGGIHNMTDYEHNYPLLFTKEIIAKFFH
jgi:hypothetical protein